MKDRLDTNLTHVMLMVLVSQIAGWYWVFIAIVITVVIELTKLWFKGRE